MPVGLQAHACGVVVAGLSSEWSGVKQGVSNRVEAAPWYFDAELSGLACGMVRDGKKRATKRAPGHRHRLIQDRREFCWIIIV